MQQKLPKPMIFGVLASLATGILTLLILKTRSEKKSKKIPQLHLNNPGSQDDFPKPPIESEVG